MRAIIEKIIEGVNETLDAVITPMNAAAKQLGKMAEGDELSELDETAYKGDFKDMIQNLNKVRMALYRLIEDALSLSEAAIEGKLSTRADVSLHKGGYRKVVEGVNNTLDAVIEPVNEAAAVLDEMAKGNLKCCGGGRLPR